MNIPAHWKGPAPIPDPEVRAHPRGSLQFECPSCSNLHSQDQGFWRTAQIRCRRVGCQHRFRVGLGFTTEQPKHRCLFVGAWKLNIANKINPQGTPLAGRIFGPIDWTCLSCNTTQTTRLEFKLGSISCEACTVTWFIQLLIYTPLGSKNICPYDWTVFTPKVNDQEI